MGRKKKATSKAYQVTISPRAERQKEDIEDYISLIQDQVSNAGKVDGAFERVFARIASNPYAFKACEEIPTPNKIIRKATCLSWHVIYKILETEVLIVAITHHSQKASKIEELGKLIDR